MQLNALSFQITSPRSGSFPPKGCSVVPGTTATLIYPMPKRWPKGHRNENTTSKLLKKKVVTEFETDAIQK